MSRQVWQISRLTAIFVFFSFVIGLPLGNWLAHLKLYGSSEGVGFISRRMNLVS